MILLGSFRIWCSGPILFLIFRSRQVAARCQVISPLLMSDRLQSVPVTIVVTLLICYQRVHYVVLFAFFHRNLFLHVFRHSTVGMVTTNQLGIIFLITTTTRLAFFFPQSIISHLVISSMATISQVNSLPGHRNHGNLLITFLKLLQVWHLINKFAKLIISISVKDLGVWMVDYISLIFVSAKNIEPRITLPPTITLHSYTPLKPSDSLYCLTNTLINMLLIIFAMA